MKIEEILNEKRVESSWIIDLTYNRPNRRLTMNLANGTVYTINNISRSTFDRWTLSPSKGLFFHNNIKDVYPIKRIR